MSARSRPPCALTELGMVSGLGRSVEEIWQRLIAGDQSRFTTREDLVPGVAQLYGQVTGELPALPCELERYASRNNQLALAAFEPIRAGVDATIQRHGAHRIAVVVGSSTTGIADVEEAFRASARADHAPPIFEPMQLEFGGVADFLSRVSGAAGPSYTISTACSSGAKALISARSLIELEIADVVIAGGIDSLCRLTANGFGALQAVSKRVTNPLSRNRDGITLGEAAALFLVTRDSGGVQLLGTGESSDAHHMSAPQPDGIGAEKCMRAALADAGLESADISYLNLHGTGTPLNDAMESAAVDRVFGKDVLCSSTKPLVGHTLAASGALEAGFCWMMLSRRRGHEIEVPPHCWDGEADPELPALVLAGVGSVLEPAGPVAMMSNSFGFGGNNSALVLGDDRC